MVGYNTLIVAVQQGGGTLVPITKDVTIQVEFNPAQVQAYRLPGYEFACYRTKTSTTTRLMPAKSVQVRA